MSTQIAKIKGRCETINSMDYERSHIDLTRFWAGSENGRMLQITISDFDNVAHVQLTRKQVKQLAKVLKNAFNDDIYPSE